MEESKEMYESKEAMDKAKALKKGKTLGILGIVFAFLIPLAGLILAHYSKKSYETAHEFYAKLPKWAWWLSWANIALNIILNIVSRG